MVLFLQVPNKAGDDRVPVGGKYARVPQLLLPLHLLLGSEQWCLKGAWVEVAGKYVKPWGPASFLIVLVQHIQKANSGGFFCSLQQRESCG